MIAAKELNEIEIYLKNAGAKDKVIIAELLDYMTIFIDLEIEKGNTFQEAFELAKIEITPEHIKAFQTQHNSIKNLPSFFNKTSLTFLGIFTGFILIYAIYLKINLLPNRKLFQIIGGIGFAYVFIPLSFIYFLIKSELKLITTLLFFGLFIFVHGCFGLFAHWHASIYLLISGFFLMTISFILFLDQN